VCASSLVALPHDVVRQNKAMPEQILVRACSRVHITGFRQAARSIGSAVTTWGPPDSRTARERFWVGAVDTVSQALELIRLSRDLTWILAQQQLRGFSPPA
jgi:hypothetical protein